MQTRSKLKSFYSKELAKIQKNAKTIKDHPILSNVDHIREQLNELKKNHRQFLFASFAEEHGELIAQELMQTNEVKEVVENFDNLKGNQKKRLDERAGKILPGGNILKRLRSGILEGNGAAANDLRKELIQQLKDNMPDILKIPKTNKKHPG